MGAYHEASCKLEIATVEKDEDVSFFLHTGKGGV
jgi:hypothetical protein